MAERRRMQLTSGYYNSFETVIGALEKGGQEAKAAGYVAHGACLLYAAVELRHVWAERMMMNAPVKPLLATRFKLSFNKAGNCTTFRRDQAEQLEGEWVWLINATNGMNDPLYAAPPPQSKVPTRELVEVAAKKLYEMRHLTRWEAAAHEQTTYRIEAEAMLKAVYATSPASQPRDDE